MPEDEVTETAELIGLVEGTVKELKKYVRNNSLSDEQLEKILEAEKDTKNRKTAVEFLEKRLGVEQEEDNKENGETEEGPEKEPEEKNGENDTEEEPIDREELLEILGGTLDEVKDWVEERDPSDEQLHEILHAEKMVKDRSTVEEFLQSYSKKKDLKKEIEEAKHDLDELREDLETIEENLDEDIDISDIELNVDEDEESEESDEEEESEEDMDEEKVENEEELKDEEDVEESTDEEASLEEKKELAKEIEADLSEDELKDISMEELKAIRDEKSRREELIEELKKEFEEEELRKASTSDLEKLKKGLEKNEDEENEEEEKSVEEKNKEMREEAQEDLEILMGAVKSKDGGDGKVRLSYKEKINRKKDEIRENMAEKIPFMNKGEEDEEEEGGMKEEKLLELLEEYSELSEYEAAIKTAHIMKGYLEYSQGIERELTYRELGEEVEADSEDMETLLQFFDRMHKDQYTGNITENMDEVIASAKAVVEG